MAEPIVVIVASTPERARDMACCCFLVGLDAFTCYLAVGAADALDKILEHLPEIIVVEADDAPLQRLVRRMALCDDAGIGPLVVSHPDLMMLPKILTEHFLFDTSPAM